MPLVLPQSPRWLLLHGHREKAIEALKSLDFSAVEAEKDLLGPAAEQQMNTRQPGPVEGLTMLFRKPYRKPALLALYVLGVIQLSGIDGVLYVSLSPTTLPSLPLMLTMRKTDTTHPPSSPKPASPQKPPPFSPQVSPPS